jgi:hypothetical protein
VNATSAAGDAESLRLAARSRPLGAPHRDAFRTASDVFKYVQRSMPLPKERAGSLSTEDYWKILNFMLLAHGVELPESGVNAANAGSVEL